MKIYVAFDAETDVLKRCFLTRKAVEKYCNSYSKDHNVFISFVEVELDPYDVEDVWTRVKEFFE